MIDLTPRQFPGNFYYKFFYNITEVSQCSSLVAHWLSAPGDREQGSNQSGEVNFSSFAYE